MEFRLNRFNNKIAKKVKTYKNTLINLLNSIFLRFLNIKILFLDFKDHK